MAIRVTRKLEANTQAQVLAIRQHTQKQEVGVVRRRRREHYLAATTKAPKQKARRVAIGTCCESVAIAPLGLRRSTESEGLKNNASKLDMSVDNTQS